MKIILSTIIVILIFSGCANIPLTERGLVVGKDTTAGIEDLGVASINRQF